jgi:hypothetical protein
VGATYEVEAKPSDPALSFGAEAEPSENPVLTLVEWTELRLEIGKMESGGQRSRGSGLRNVGKEKKIREDSEWACCTKNRILEWG